MYFLGLFVVISVIGFSNQEKIKVTVYYESLCPASIEFITEQLYPGYQQLGGDALTVEMVPYVTGVKKRNEKGNKWFLSCQHGEAECYANKAQACVLHLNATQDQMMSFFGCHLDIENPELRTNIKKCLRKSKLDWINVKNCLQNEGDEYLVEYHNKTKKLEPALQYLPHILFNDVTTNEDAEQGAREDFVAEVCKMYKDEKPNGCTSSSE